MSTINFNDKIFSQEILKAFVANLPLLGAFAKDFSSVTKAKGDAVAVPLLSALTATTFASYETAGGTLSTVTVNLNVHRHVPVDISDIQSANSSAAKFDNFAANAGAALAESVIARVLSLVTTGGYGAAVITTSAALWTRTQVRAFRKALNVLRAPSRGRIFVSNLDIEDALLGDTNITQAYAYGGSEAIREGKVPRLMGFDMFGTDMIPLNGISLAAFACVPDAIAVAMRYLAPQDPTDLSAAEMATDPATGITIGYRRHYARATGVMYANVECLFGFAAGLTPGLVLATIP